MKFSLVTRWLLLVGTVALLAGCRALSDADERAASFEPQFPPAAPTRYNAPEMY